MGATNGSSFVLSGGRQSELQRYVNSRVEITGTLDTSAGAGSGMSSGSGGSTTSTSGTGSTAGSSTSSGGGMGSSGSMSGQTAPQHLRVSSVRQLSSTCSGGGQQ